MVPNKILPAKYQIKHGKRQESDEYLQLISVRLCKHGYQSDVNDEGREDTDDAVNSGNRTRHPQQHKRSGRRDEVRYYPRRAGKFPKLRIACHAGRGKYQDEYARAMPDPRTLSAAAVGSIGKTNSRPPMDPQDRIQTGPQSRVALALALFQRLQKEGCYPLIEHRKIRRRLIAGTLVGSLLIVIILLLWNQARTVNPTAVHPSIRSLKKPYREVSCAFLGDGGSRAVTIRDASGQITSYWIAYPMGNAAMHDKLFLGNYQDGQLIDEMQYPQTRMELLRIIETSGTHDRRVYRCDISCPESS